MNHPFDALTPETLRQKACVKWNRYPDDVLPLWVADMDFPVAEVIKQGVRRYLETDDFGYPPDGGIPGLKAAVIARLQARYNWQVSAQQLMLINGIVPGLFLGVEALSSVGDEVLMHAPIYGPFMMAVEQTGRRPLYSRLIHDGAHWHMDIEGLEALITPATRILMLCNPQNPVGRVFTRKELEQLAEVALKHRLWVISDELHSDITYPGHSHIPFASLGPEVAERTLTLFGPTKAFNIAGFKTGFAISHNEALLRRVKQVATGHVGAPDVLAQAATLAAYRDGDDWLAGVLSYLKDNRDFVAEFIQTELPRVRFSAPEGTYLAWLDLRDYKLENVEAFMLEHAKVGLNNGAWFGPGGEGFGRLNFATSRRIVSEALERIRDALNGL
jgi:cystathionine beta-lyase